MDIDAEPANDEHPRQTEKTTTQTSPLLSLQHSAVLDQSRTSPLGGAIAPSLTDLARRAPQTPKVGTKERALQVEQ